MFSSTSFLKTATIQLIRSSNPGVRFCTTNPQKSFLHIAAAVCEHHSEDRSGWKHPWVCITEGGDPGKRAIWVWVDGILLDSSNEALILDCCIMPVDRMVDAASARLGKAVAQDNYDCGPGVSFVEVCR